MKLKNSSSEPTEQGGVVAGVFGTFLPILMWSSSLHNRVISFTFGMTRAISKIMILEQKIFKNLNRADKSPKTTFSSDYRIAFEKENGF